MAAAEEGEWNGDADVKFLGYVSSVYPWVVDPRIGDRPCNPLQAPRDKVTLEKFKTVSSGCGIAVYWVGHE